MLLVRPTLAAAGSLSRRGALLPGGSTGMRLYSASRVAAAVAPAAAAGAGSGSSTQLSGVAKAKLEKEKRAKKKKAKTLQIKVRSGPTFHPDEALRIVKASASAGFDESVELQVQLGIDPRKPNQSIRGIAQLPRGTGKVVSIAVFARGEKAEEARRAGATIVGAEDLVEAISKGDVPVNFTKTIATPDVMPLVGRIARILGPRGLMPNPKLGTVTLAVREAVAAAKKGQAEFRAEKRGIVSTAFGKVSFPAADLRENLRALCLAIGDTKPEGLKGAFLRCATMKSTMGPGIPIDVTRLDPANPLFLDTPVGAAAAAAAMAAAPTSPAAAVAVSSNAA